MNGALVRPALAADAAVCAAILNAWIDATDWMPRLRPADQIERHYTDFVFQNRRVWVWGDPVEGYLSLDTDAGEVTSLYAARLGHGAGKALMDTAKAEASRLTLWTFVANTGARRFYQREGFHEVERSGGDNEEGLPDIRFAWERSHA